MTAGNNAIVVTSENVLVQRKKERSYPICESEVEEIKRVAHKKEIYKGTDANICSISIGFVITGLISVTTACFTHIPKEDAPLSGIFSDWNFLVPFIVVMISGSVAIYSYFKCRQENKRLEKEGNEIVNLLNRILGKFNDDC